MIAVTPNSLGKNDIRSGNNLTGVAMTDPTEKEDIVETIEDPQLLLDGTANLDYPDEEQVPRVRGLVEILEQYLGSRD